MTHDVSTGQQSAGAAPHGGAVISLGERRRDNDVLSTISFVFGGVHFGTFTVDARYTRGKPLVLYFVPRHDDNRSTELSGPIDCLVTDDAQLGADTRAGAAR